MRQLLSALVALGITAVAAGQGDEADLKAFQGTWRLKSLTVDGNEIATKDIGDSTWTFAGRMYRGSRDGKPTGQGAFKIDPAKKPKTIDLMPAQGAAKGKTLPGIYELAGDTLKICFAYPDRLRPGAFASPKRSGHVLQVFTRAKSK